MGSTGDVLQTLGAPEEFDRLLDRELALIFKHSSRCPISFDVLREVEDFARSHPQVPLFLVRVVEERGLSQYVSGKTGVPHESPQAILLRGGRVAWHASHWEVSARALEEQLSQVMEEAE